MKIPKRCYECPADCLCPQNVLRKSEQCQNYHEALELKLQSAAPTNIESDAIFEAAKEWTTDNPNAFGINGFWAGVYWAQKQHTVS